MDKQISMAEQLLTSYHELHVIQKTAKAEMELQDSANENQNAPSHMCYALFNRLVCAIGKDGCRRYIFPSGSVLLQPQYIYELSGFLKNWLDEAINSLGEIEKSVIQLLYIDRIGWRQVKAHLAYTEPELERNRISAIQKIDKILVYQLIRNVAEWTGKTGK